MLRLMNNMSPEVHVLHAKTLVGAAVKTLRGRTYWRCVLSGAVGSDLFLLLLISGCYQGLALLTL